MLSKKNITGIILAGGESSRMGTNKALVLYRGMTFIQKIINVMRPLVNQVIIVGRPEEYHDIEIRCVNDIFPESGPVAGLHAGLESSSTDYNLVLSCDVPLINETILMALIDNIDKKYDVVMVESKGQSHPLIAIYQKRCKDLFNEQLFRGEKRLLSAIDQLRVKNISLSDTDALYVTNINHPSTLIKLNNEDID
jgi:molybdopterin-guanine dinucleotide biosynthesis protein A